MPVPVEHLIFLVHPCCYEPLEAERIRREGLRLFLEREEEVKARWLTDLAERGEGTLFAQLGGPACLRGAAADSLGEGGALLLQSPFPESGDLTEYYRRLKDELLEHLRRHDLALDPAAATSELWGESFEGCVPGYGGAFAHHLGLARAPRMRFEMTVYDSRFLHQARRWEPLALPGSDVEAWLFECHDGTGAATFQPRLTPQWLDRRRLRLKLNDRRHQLCDKQGHAVWPVAPWEKGEPEREHDVTVAMKEWINRWVRGVGTGMDEFRAVVEAARLTAP